MDFLSLRVRIVFEFKYSEFRYVSGRVSGWLKTEISGSGGYNLNRAGHYTKAHCKVNSIT